MKKIDNEEMKKIMLDIMVAIDAFCKENSLMYYLCGGTLIGAVRHNGFIPWDDDMDIAMPRKDYEVFLSRFNAFCANYKVFDCENNYKYPYPFAKVSDVRTKYIEHVEHEYEMGVFIDVFPIDEFDSEKNAMKVLRKGTFYRMMIQNSLLKPYQKNLIKRLVWKMMKNVTCIVGSNYFACKIENYMKSYFRKNEGGNVSHCGVVVWGYGRCEIVSAEVFKSGVECDFETKRFYIPVGYDEWLRSIYGDYMKLPPEEEQKGHHGGEAYWI